MRLRSDSNPAVPPWSVSPRDNEKDNNTTGIHLAAVRSLNTVLAMGSCPRPLKLIGKEIQLSEALAGEDSILQEL